MTEQKVLITLRPLQPYFFGGEETFGPPGESSNYFAKSRKLPQQTTLLGMLRYELLAIKGWLNNNEKEKGNALVGEKSFDGITKDFGIIEGLSPLFLMKEEDAYLPLPKAHFYDDDSQLRHYDLQDMSQGESQSTFILSDSHGEDYTAKNYFAEAWINANDVDQIVKEDDIFKSSEKVGIRKSREGKTETHAFFKQAFYQLAKGWKMAFVFSFKTEDAAIIDYFKLGKKYQVELGGERSTFLMEIKDAIPEPTLPAKYPKSKDYEKVILKSDAYIRNLSTLYEQAIFSITDPVSFRNIRSESSKAKTFHWSKMDRSEAAVKTAPHKSVLHYLIKKGAVFFCEDAEVFSKNFKVDAFRKIGYNYFDTIKKTST